MYTVSNRPLLTMFMILVNIIVYIITFINIKLLYLFAQTNLLVLKNGFYWQLLTSMFIHFNIIHLLFNMLGLFYFGSFIENVYGKLGFLIIYFGSGLLGNLATLYLIPPRVISGGASGAVFGLIGAHVAIRREVGDVSAALFYALMIFLWSSGPQVNIVAHLFGLIGGILIGIAILKILKSIHSRRREVTVIYYT